MSVWERHESLQRDMGTSYIQDVLLLNVLWPFAIVTVCFLDDDHLYQRAHAGFLDDDPLYQWDPGF